MTKIHIPTPLRQYAGKLEAVEVSAGTIGDALSQLVTQHPDLRRHLYTDEGRLRAFVNVYLNDEDIRYLHKEATVIGNADTISIVPSIAGGSLANAQSPELQIAQSICDHALCCCSSCCCRAR